MRQLELQQMLIGIGPVTLPGDLRQAENSLGLVVFAHGSGSSRLSVRNTYVAERLREAGISSLLFDLLTEQEDQDYGNRFNIELLTQRLLGAANWLRAQPKYVDQPLAFFGASTGAAAALLAAARMPGDVKAVVSRGGRPDLAIQEIAKVTCPTLFIVGGEDTEVIELNKKAATAMASKTFKKLEIIPGASHLFEEPGTLEQVATLATTWFKSHLTDAPLGVQEDVEC